MSRARYTFFNLEIFLELARQMVSFQCHGCGDVVKKPKLDQHRGRCHTGFDCIDCHTTFNGPAEYKGHTSCISEAEKYQKGLYNGPKTSAPAPRNNYPPLPASEPMPASNGGGWGRSYGRQNIGRPRVTGANDTPLGTPKRLSPVPPPSALKPPPPPITNGTNKDVAKVPDATVSAVDTVATVKKKKRIRKGISRLLTKSRPQWQHRRVVRNRALKR